MGFRASDLGFRVRAGVRLRVGFYRIAFLVAPRCGIYSESMGFLIFFGEGMEKKLETSIWFRVCRDAGALIPKLG